MLGTAELDSYVKQRFGIKGYWMQKPPKNTKIRGLLFSGRLTQEAINKAVINSANIILVFDPYYDVDMKQLDNIYVYIVYLERWITGKLGAIMLSRAFNLDLKMYREQENIWMRCKDVVLKNILSRFREVVILTGDTDMYTKRLLLCFGSVDLANSNARVVVSTTIDSQMIYQARTRNISLIYISMDLLLNEITRQLWYELKMVFPTYQSRTLHTPIEIMYHWPVTNLR